MSVHQCAPVFNNPCLGQKITVISIAKYLASTSKYVDLPDGNRRLSTNALVYRTDIEKFIDCYVDTNFSGVWAQ